MKRPTLIVVGGGVGGAAAALRAAQYDLPTVWILGDRDTSRTSRAAYVINIDNMIGIHPAIVQGKVADLLRVDAPEAARQVEATHIHISTRDLVANARARIAAEYSAHVSQVEDRADEATRIDSGFRVKMAGGSTIEGQSLLLSTGVMDRQPTVHKKRGERALSGIHWVFPYANHEALLYCIRCEGHLTRGHRVAVLGSGNEAAEVALMIRERYGSEVILLTTGEPIAWNDERARLLTLEKVEVREGRLVDIHGADRGATLKGFDIEEGERIEVDFAFVSMGLHRVYNDLARALGADLEETDAPPERRHVIVDRNGETSVPGLFAVGDMTRRRDELVMKQVYTVQEYAVRAVDTVDRRRRREHRRELLDQAAGRQGS
jgi:thioredoxin reductase (NADPH)